MLIPPVRETVACPDIDRQSWDFTGTRRVINICPWLNYPFSLLLAASLASDTPSAAATLSHQHTTPVSCQHNYLHGWTANWFSWKTTWKQSSVPKCNLLQSCMNICAGTKGETVRRWEHAALDMAWLSWHHCPQGHGQGSHSAAPVQGTDSISIWERSFWQSFLTNISQKDGVCIQGETWTFSYLTLSTASFFK